MSKGRFLTEADIDYIEERLRDVFTTKEDFLSYRSELLGKLDKILGEILKSRDEQTVLAHLNLTTKKDRREKPERSGFDRTGPVFQFWLTTLVSLP